MPERTHTRFEDESKNTHINGIARYMHEFRKPNDVPLSLASDEVQQSTQPSQPHGIKRSRSGSPKAIISTFKTSVREIEVEASQGVDEKENTLINRHAEKPNVAGEKVETTENVQENEKLTVEPKSFYGNSQTLSNISQLQTSRFGDHITKTTSTNGQVSPVGRRHDGGSRMPNGENGNGIRKHSIDMLESRGSRPSSFSLKKIADGLLRDRKKLPIWAHKADIRWALRYSDVLLLVGETGSGKSTQVPQFLISEPWFRRQIVQLREDNGEMKELAIGGRVAITEPRRVAATSLAQRVAAECGSYLGRGQLNDDDKVAYSVRFDSIMPRKAKIKFLTEGMLLQELLRDPYLRRYSAVIIDEIHERSVDVDLLAGFLRNIVLGDRTGRGGIPLKLIIMSATANMEGLQKFFARDLLTADVPAIEDFKSNGGIEENNNQPLSNSNHANESGIESKVNPVPEPSDSAYRRTSDASYSSWDGISSDNEANGVPELSSSSVPNTEKNGKDAGYLSKSKDIDHALINRNLGTNRSQIGKASEADQVSDDGVVVHHIKGRQHPVKIFYTPEPVTDYIEATLKTIFKIHVHEKMPGDILAFLTGQEEIETLQKLVEQHAEMLAKRLPRLNVLGLYGHQTNEQQQATFTAPRGKYTRKVILATNIAETSITVPGVRYVIDCGKAKIKQHRSRLGLQSLLIKPISKSSAIQRKGRAGREAPGQCYRLYTEAEYLKLSEADIPEILRSDVVEAVLRMKARGVRDVLAFPLMDPPDVYAMEKALLTLHSIGALTDDGELSEIGLQMADFPLPAAYSRVLVAAAEPDADCLLEAIDIISCLTAGDDIFIQPRSEAKRDEVEEARRELFRREGDILTYLTAMQKYTSENVNRSEWCQKRLISIRDLKYAMSIRKQLQDTCLRWNMLTEKPPPDPQPFVPISAERAEIILKCFMKAFAMRTASLQPDGTYCTTVGKHVVAIHPSSVLYGKKVEAVMFLEHVYTQKNYAKKVSAIQMNWIAEVLDME